ncbi:adhesion G-protein coupled receptor G1-like [Carassius auratus]|uniref:Adhesion G-protein coupled receptor G1-like n=1 Tax=Carassius auratus TaxID=7957 RepID=A0A6P6RAT5_CARAU|nr:adhesion G-protein coupled receptor G1-like [Carassius auratus]
MSGQKQNLLWLMIICCALCQISTDSSKNLIIQVNTSDHCFLNSISSPYPDICLTARESTAIFTINISSFGQCRSYSFNITKQGQDYEFRMNETVEGIKLTKDNCLSSRLHSEGGVNCQPGGSIISITRINQQTVCQNIDPVDPREKCSNALFDKKTCKENERNKYILSQNGNSNWKCVSCEKRAIFNITTNLRDNDGIYIPSKASDALNSLKSKIEEMLQSNTSNVAIVMEDVIGLLHIQDKNTETKDICYSSKEDVINVFDCQSDLKAGFPWFVKISSEAFNKSRRENNGTAFVGILQFKNMRNTNGTQNYSILNNVVYGVTMGANIHNLTNSIDMTFEHKDKVSNESCVSWDGKGELNWTTFGCVTETIDSNTIKCSCSHLTFFAVLMIPQSDVSNDPVPDLESLTLITSIGCGISMFFMAIALFMHFLLRKAKSNQATKILMNMFVALSLLNASFLSNESVANTGDNAACVFIALLLHYSMLASFTWFFIQALHMYLWLIRQNVSITNYMRKITVLGWVFPTPIVIAIASVGEYKTVIIKSTSGKISRMCWITNPVILYIVNIGYYALVFIFTTGIFITILTRVVQARRLRAIDGKRKTFRKQLMMVLSLFLLFGLTWSVAFFSYGPMRIPSYYIFTVLNSFQGFFLFLYYYYIHNDVEGRFSDDPRSSGSTTTMVPPNMNGLENVYNYPN